MKELNYPNVVKNYYTIDRQGNIKNKNGLTLKHFSTISYRNGRDYKAITVGLTKEKGGRSSFVLARLLMYNFNYIKGCEELQVNHIDGNTENNSLENLEWVTPKENMIHASENDLVLKGSEHQNAKLSEDDTRELVELLNEGVAKPRLAKMFNVSVQTITAFEKGKYYKSQREGLNSTSSTNRDYDISDIKKIKELLNQNKRGKEIAIEVFGEYLHKHAVLISKIKNNRIYTDI